MTRQQQTAWAAWSKDIATALETAQGAQTPELALVASDALHGLIGKLQDGDAQDEGLSAEVVAALPQLRAALQQVNKLRLSKREFVEASAAEFVGELMQKDPLAVFEQKYRGRYFRWKVKFKCKGETGGFIVYAGEHLEAVCALDACVPEGTLERLESWEVVTMEGRCTCLEAFGKAVDPRRARITFDQCIIG